MRLNPENGFPDNMLRDIFGGDPPDELLARLFGDNPPETLPADFIPTLYYLVYTGSERRADILFAYYRDGLSLWDIGKRYNVTRERIRQQISTAFKELRHPERLKILLGGLCAYQTAQVRQAREPAPAVSQARELEIRAETIRDVRASILDVFREISDEMKEAQDTVSENDAAAPMTLSLLTPISKIGLTTRTYNCLRRASVTTVQDIIEMGPSNLRKVRHLGKITYAEITDVLVKRFGENPGLWALPERHTQIQKGA